MQIILYLIRYLLIFGKFWFQFPLGFCRKFSTKTFWIQAIWETFQIQEYKLIVKHFLLEVFYNISWFWFDAFKWDFLSSLFFLKYPPVLSSALSPVPKETVYHVLIRLNHEQFLSQYTDLGHSVTLLLTERLMQQVRIITFNIITFTKYRW